MHACSGGRGTFRKWRCDAPWGSRSIQPTSRPMAQPGPQCNRSSRRAQVSMHKKSVKEQMKMVEDTYPVTLAEHMPCKAMCASCQKARRTANKSLIDNGDLQKVLGQRPGLNVVVIGLADSTQKAHGTRRTKLKLEHRQHESFSLED